MVDGDYGNLERNNVTGRQEWTGLIGQFVFYLYIYLGSIVAVSFLSLNFMCCMSQQSCPFLYCEYTRQLDNTSWTYSSITNNNDFMDWLGMRSVKNRLLTTFL